MIKAQTRSPARKDCSLNQSKNEHRANHSPRPSSEVNQSRLEEDQELDEVGWYYMLRYDMPRIAAGQPPYDTV